MRRLAWAPRANASPSCIHPRPQVCSLSCRNINAEEKFEVPRLLAADALHGGHLAILYVPPIRRSADGREARRGGYGAFGQLHAEYALPRLSRRLVENAKLIVIKTALHDDLALL